MKYIISLLIIIFSFSNTYAQKIKAKTVLATALNDKRLQLNTQTTTFAQGLRYHLPIIKQVEARIGINGSSLGDSLFGSIRNEDVYGLNISTNSFKEIRLQKLVKQAQIEALASENRVFEQAALLERYQTLSAFYFSQKLILEKQKLDSLIGKKHDILRVMVEQGQDIKVKDVMDTEGDKNTVQLALMDLENTMRTKRALLSLFLASDNSADIDFSDFIVPSKIQEIINDHSRVSNHPVIEFRNARSNLTASKLNYISAQNRQVFNSLRLGYQDPIFLEERKKFNPLNNFSIRVGLVVPLPGNNNYRRSDALLELREAQDAVTLSQDNYKRAVDLQNIKLSNLMVQYDLTKATIEQSLINKMLGNKKLLSQITPLEIADLTIAQQKIKVRTLEIEIEITNEYLKYLDFTGILSQKPLKNYLSMGLDSF